jgi:hypothetical protein
MSGRPPLQVARRLPLGRTGGEAGDVVVDEEGVGDRHRDRAEHGGCHERAPEVDIGLDEVADDADRYGLSVASSHCGICCFLASGLRTVSLTSPQPS